MNTVSQSRLASFLRYAGFAASLVALVALVSAGGCRKKYPVATKVEYTPEEIKELVSMVKGPKKKVGFIDDIRVPSAERLGEIGPQAKEHGAVEVLEKLAKDKNPAAKEAAEKALARIKGS